MLETSVRLVAGRLGLHGQIAIGVNHNDTHLRNKPNNLLNTFPYS
jgi:hypothetical protein